MVLKVCFRGRRLDIRAPGQNRRVWFAGDVRGGDERHPRQLFGQL